MEHKSDFTDSHTTETAEVSKIETRSRKDKGVDFGKYSQRKELYMDTGASDVLCYDSSPRKRLIRKEVDRRIKLFEDVEESGLGRD